MLTCQKERRKIIIKNINKEKELQTKFRNWKKSFKLREVDLGFTNQKYVLDEKWFLRISQPHTRFSVQFENQIAILPFLNKTNISLKTKDFFFDKKKRFHFITKFISQTTTFKNEINNFANLRKIANLIKHLQLLPINNSTLKILDLKVNLINHLPLNWAKKKIKWQKQLDLIFFFLQTVKKNHLVPAHNDLVPENILVTEDKKYYLIDFEYCSLNIPEYDIAIFACENQLFLSDVLWKYWLKLFKITTTAQKKQLVYLMLYHELLVYFWINKTKNFSANQNKYTKLSQEKELNINHFYQILVKNNSSLF